MGRGIYANNVYCCYFRRRAQRLALVVAGGQWQLVPQLGLQAGGAVQPERVYNYTITALFHHQRAVLLVSRPAIYWRYRSFDLYAYFTVVARERDVRLVSADYIANVTSNPHALRHTLLQTPRLTDLVKVTMSIAVHS